MIWVGSEGGMLRAKGLDTDLLICPTTGKFGSNYRDKNGNRLTAAMRRKCVGWVKYYCETHHMRRSNRWVSLRSTHPTRSRCAPTGDGVEPALWANELFSLSTMRISSVPLIAVRSSTAKMAEAARGRAHPACPRPERARQRTARQTGRRRYRTG